MASPPVVVAARVAAGFICQGPERGAAGERRQQSARCSIVHQAAWPMRRSQVLTNAVSSPVARSPARAAPAPGPGGLLAVGAHRGDEVLHRGRCTAAITATRGRLVAKCTRPRRQLLRQTRWPSMLTWVRHSYIDEWMRGHRRCSSQVQNPSAGAMRKHRRCLCPCLGLGGGRGRPGERLGSRRRLVERRACDGVNGHGHAIFDAGRRCGEQA